MLLVFDFLFLLKEENKVFNFLMTVVFHFLLLLFWIIVTFR